MTGFEQRISCDGSDCSTNWAPTTYPRVVEGVVHGFEAGIIQNTFLTQNSHVHLKLEKSSF